MVSPLSRWVWSMAGSSLLFARTARSADAALDQPQFGDGALDIKALLVRSRTGGAHHRGHGQLGLRPCSHSCKAVLGSWHGLACWA